MMYFQYFIIVLSVLVCICSLYAVAWIWPQCMGFSLDPEALMKSVQRNYGVTGQDQLTAAVDLAQASVIFMFMIIEPLVPLSILLKRHEICTNLTVQLLRYSLSQRVRHILMETARLRTAPSCPFNLLRPEQSPRRPFLFKSSTGEHHFVPGFRKRNSWGVPTYSCKHLIVRISQCS